MSLVRLVDFLTCPMCGAADLTLAELEGDDAFVVCGGCRRYYPVCGGVPVMLPDDARGGKADRRFWKTYRARLPEDVRSFFSTFDPREE